MANVTRHTLQAIGVLAGLLCGGAASAQTLVPIVAAAARHEHGEGVPRDEALAANLYCYAARLGDANAQYALGWMIANGRGFARDDGMAWRLFALAAGQQHMQAATLMASLPPRPDAALPACMQPPPAPIVVAVAPVPETAAPSYPASTAPVQRLVERLAPAYDIDPALALAVIAVESGFRANAVSPRNAQGLMQLIPATARRFGVVNPFDPEANIRGGLSYLRWLVSEFNGDVRLVAAAYNAGENAVRRHGGVPPFPETRNYVQRIVSLYSSPVHDYHRRVSRQLPSP